MKKILLTFLFLFAMLSANAATFNPESRVTTVGNTLISKNGLPSVNFYVTNSSVDNGDVVTSKKLYVSRDKLKYAGNDNEVASVIAQEMGAIVNASASKKSLINSVSNSILGNINSDGLYNFASMTQQLALSNMNTKDLMNADITGADLMIKAGYNPLAMIVVLGKMEGSLTDAFKMQPANLERTMNIYDYLSYNYPEKVKAGYACNEYRNFVAYIQPTIDERNSDKKALEKFQKEQANAKKERENQLLKYKVTGGANGWNVTQTLLKK